MIPLARNLRRITSALSLGKFTPAFGRAVLAAALVCSSSGKASDLWQKHYAKRKPVIAKFQAAINREIGFAKSDVLRNIARASHVEQTALKSADGKGAAFDFLFDPADLDAGLRATVRNEHAEALQTAGNELFDEVGRDDVFTMPPKAAKEFIEGRENLLVDVSQEIFDSIKEELRAALDAGESMAKIAKRIESKFEEIEEGRAATIASTEVAAAYGYARDEAMQQAGIEYKQWLGSGLPTMRDTHREASAEGQTVALDEPFTVGGEKLMYPGDAAGSAGNVINCHCVAIAVENKEGLGGIDAEGNDT